MSEGIEVVELPGAAGAVVVSVDATTTDPDGAASSYAHHQLQPAAVWIVPHGLGRRPVAWSLYDDQGRHRDEYVVEHPELNRAVVRMDVPTAGTFYMI